MYYPLVVLILIGPWIVPGFRVYIKEIIDVFFSASLMLIPILFIPKENLRSGLALFFTFLLCFLVFVKLSFYYHYEVKINASAFFVIFETYASEASAFLTNYFDWFVLVLMVLLLFPLYVFYTHLKKSIGFQFRLKGIPYMMLGLLLMFGSVFCLVWKFQKENLAIAIYNSYQDYNVLKLSMKDKLAKPMSESMKVMSFSKEPQTNIVIIGESTSRWHMQLYGYNRETSPLLKKMKDELLVFNDVITPNVHTILALEKILTLSDYNHPQKKENGSIIQLANQAGFDTYWLSNQRPMGLHESIATLIGNASKHSYFINSEDFEDAVYDEKLFPVLDTILMKSSQKKLIFIHLSGTHISYNKRYPERFEYFKNGHSVSEFATEISKSIIDSYDNAIRYNDYIVSTIIEKARKIESLGYVVYFSDHGDEVYDTMDLMGHNEYYATRPMYEIPFVVWLSNNYKSKHINSENYKSFVNRPYNLENFIHSFSELTDIKFDGFDETKSIFSSNFEERTRWIKENVDYDHR